MSLLLAVLLALWCRAAPAGQGADAQSVCYGTTARGRLEHGVRLPYAGENYTAYSRILAGAGRTHVHDRVRTAVVNAYGALENTHPEKTYVYGETGWATGGRIKPHKTHQNGLSVDFMVPVVDDRGRSIALPTGPFNKYGYAIEFDGRGHCPELGLRIDFEALAAHLKAQHLEALRAGIGIWRVIFDPRLQPLLFDTADGAYLQSHLQIPP